MGLDQALDGARALITFNSTAGVGAMLQGVKVISHPSAHYHAAGQATDERIRQDYMHRLAYAQWKLEEFSSGEAVEFVLQHIPPR